MDSLAKINHLKDFLSKASRQEKIEYIGKFLIDRRARKNLVFEPCQVELKTLPLPGKKYITELVGDYHNFCQSLGYKSRLTKTDLDFQDFKPNHSITIDTREKKPFNFHIPSIVHSLPFGDYRLNDDEFSGRCVVERKSLVDLYGTFTSKGDPYTVENKGYEKIHIEIEKAIKENFYIVIVVESEFNNTYRFIQGLRKSSGLEHLFHNIREVMQKYNNVQFLFVKGSHEGAKVTERLFCAQGDIKNVDLQYLYDKGEL